MIQHPSSSEDEEGEDKLSESKQIDIQQIESVGNQASNMSTGSIRLGKLISILLVLALEGGSFMIAPSVLCTSTTPRKGEHQSQQVRQDSSSIASNTSSSSPIDSIIESVIKLTSQVGSTGQSHLDSSSDTDDSYSSSQRSATSNHESPPTISRRDQLGASSTATDVQTHLLPANHQSYSNEMYASASYNLPMTASSSTLAPNYNQFSISTGNSSNQKQINSLLNRDHHQSRPYSDYIDNGVGSSLPSSSSTSFVSNFRDQIKDTTVADNHNYNPGTTSSLNSGLIQNLTASLFPIQQLSNATLLTLSELLNKTRQQQNHQQQQANGYRPNYNNPQSSYTTSYTIMPSTNHNLFAESVAQESPQTHNYGNLLDYLRPNQNGFRDLTSRLNQQQASSLFSRPTSMNPYSSYLNDNKHSSSSIYAKNPSNTYNTYAPYKSTTDSMPLTNGQSLGMALYDNYGSQLMRPSQQSSASTSNFMDQPNSYQYLQHHSSNNQNHLDKVVYHSTPFRPSIVSPPQSNGHSNSAGKQQSVSLFGSQQRPKTEADKKSMAFASLSSPSSNSINDSKPGGSFIITNGQALNASMHKQVNESHHKHMNPSALSAFDFDPDHTYNSWPPNNSSGLGDTYDHAKLMSVSPNQSNRTTSSSSSGTSGNNSQSTQGPSQITSASGTPPAALFDLYEREIDNQIRDALYQDAQQHALPLLSLAQANSNWLEKSPAIYDEIEAPQAPAASSSRPSAAGTSQSASYLSTSGTRTPLSSSYSSWPFQSPASSLDVLASAIQELPTFSASDLQPLLPSATSGPAYSFLPSAEITGSASTSAFTESPLFSATLPSAPLFSNGLRTTGSEPVKGSTSSSKSNNNSNNNNNQMQTSASLSMAAATGLPAILLKLQSSQVGSILTSPFAHLYANLPRYRYNKHTSSKPNSQAQKSLSSTQPSESHMNMFTMSPGSLFTHSPGGSGSSGGASGERHHYLWNLMAGSNNQAPSSSVGIGSNPQHSDSLIGDKYARQQQQQQVAIAAANLLAAASITGQPLNPFQVAMLQAQAAASSNAAYLAAATGGHQDAFAGDQLGAFYNPSIQSSTSNQQQVGSESSSSTAAPLSTLSNYVSSGLSGGGISPLIWRGILTPAAHWARKQTGGPSTGLAASLTGANHQQSNPSGSSSNFAPLISTLLNTHGSHLNGSSSLRNSHLAPLSSLLLGGSSLTNNPIMSLPSSPSVQQEATDPGGSGHRNFVGGQPIKPTIKIKILKIPVAVYDQPGTSTRGGPEASQQALMPSQMQPSLTASLLASMPCPLSHSGMSSHLAQIPHQFDQHFTIASQLPQASSPIIGQQQTYFPHQTSALSSSLNELTGMGSSGLKPGSNSLLTSTSQPSSANLSSPAMTTRGLETMKPSGAIGGFVDVSNQTDDLQVLPSNEQPRLWIRMVAV